ncbi:transcriptional regulator [Acidiferrimicrobium sp. IK]|uniref:transcriptional regulator n=1 Tax=Acidiferrimicrobium sp. IK TaxID=2871700 RepID=UPI0021CB25D4|nr:transcriptional regulator [Acidiferrimicrobium sp. IK]
MTTTYARKVGERLRKVRKQQRLSLQAVEVSSGEEFKASVLGAYERGERAISVPRLQRLARLYNVPVDQLLPKDGAGEPAWNGASEPEDDQVGTKVTIDLTRLDMAPEADSALIGRYLGMIQVQRQDFNGRVLTVREEDLRAMACLLDTRPELMRRRLEDMGLRR